MWGGLRKVVKVLWLSRRSLGVNRAEEARVEEDKGAEGGSRGGRDSFSFPFVASIEQ